jgi:hypothetical protein
MWCNGNDHRRHAIADYGRKKLGIEGFEGVHNLHADKDGSFVPEPEDGWPSKKKDMEQALNVGRNKCYDQIWEAIQDGTISTDSGAPTPPTESVNDPVIDATELMDDTDTPPDEDDMLEQRLEEGGIAEAEAEDTDGNVGIGTTDGNVGIGTTREPVVTERIEDETPNFLEMDEDLEEEVEDDEEVEIGEREMLRGLHLIIREVVKEELKGFKGVPTSKTELKKLIKQTLKEAF